MQQGMGFILNFNAPPTTEGHVISCIFKPFVTLSTASLTLTGAGCKPSSFWVQSISLQLDSQGATLTVNPSMIEE
jgi:hypothetical protein